MKIREDLRKYSAEQEIRETEALEKNAHAKSAEFLGNAVRAYTAV